MKKTPEQIKEHLDKYIESIDPKSANIDYLKFISENFEIKDFQVNLFHKSIDYLEDKIENLPKRFSMEINFSDKFMSYAHFFDFYFKITN